MNHLMIDIKSMGKTPNSAITSIGAVFFNPENGEVGEQFYQRVSLESSVDNGMVIGPASVLWYMRQGTEMRSELVSDDALDLPMSLISLEEFVANYSDLANVQVWGNGIASNNVILRNAAKTCGYSPLWNIWNDRDVNTVMELSKSLGLNCSEISRFEGIQGHALYDAIHQARLVSYVWAYIMKIAGMN